MADPGDHGCGGCGLPRCLASAKMRAGGSRVRAEGSGCYLKRPRREEGCSHDAVRGRRLRRGASGRLGAAPTGGPGRSAAGRGRLPGAGTGAAAGLATPRRAAGLQCRAGRGCWAESGGWAERGRGEEGERAKREKGHVGR